MASRFVLPLALAACGAASVLPGDANPGFVSFPVIHERSTRPILSRRADTNVPLYNVSSVSYLIKMSFGTPGQDIKVAIDTGSDELWVNPDCDSSSLTSDQETECDANGRYTPSSSSTGKKLSMRNQIPYGKGTVNLNYYADAISLPDSDIHLTNVTFGVATASVDLNEGILGLAYGIGENLPYNNFVDELALQKVTATKAFTIALGSVDADNGGIIIFGGVDTKKWNGKLAELDILPPQGGEQISRYWVNLDSIAVNQNGKSKTYTSTTVPVVLDSGSSLSYLPASVVTAMANDLGGKLDRQSGLYLVPCSGATSSNSFEFTFSGNKIRVPFDEFIWNVDGVNCVLGAEALDSGSGVTALLGDTFMRSAYTVFDQTNNKLFMAQYVNCGQNEQAITTSNGPGSFNGECSGSGSGGSGGSGSGSGSGAGGNKNAGSRTAGSAANVWVAVGLLLTVQGLMALL